MAVEVSVIVPVCNVELYLGECLQGLHAQTLRDLEILLVDDGSTDGCPLMLAQAAARDARMRVVTKENGGYGSAVNAGLARARGRYVGIVEPDDVVDAHMFEDLLAAARLVDGGWADVVKSSYWEYYDVPGREPYIKAPNLMSCMPKQPFCATVAQKPEVLLHHPSIWSAIYRREFLEERGIRMMEVPGGGWVDNPFFFETLLQAESFVWTPAAYYYYRQTNPNSSSNLKDYHLPYDRLRDLRALFARLEVTDPQVIACLYARHFFYTASVVGEWGFSEKDPELAALIREAFEAMDPAILYGRYRGLSDEYRAYYETVAGDPLADVEARPEPAAVPRASVVVPALDDREVVLGTLRSIAAQTVEDIEVVCVDCGSEDATAALAAAFAARDARFSCVSAGERSRGAGMEAGLARVHAPVCAVVLPGQALPKRHLEQCLEALACGADLAICARPGARGYSLFEEGQVEGVIQAADHKAELVLYASESLSACAFRAAFFAEADLHARAADDNGTILLYEAVGAADRVALRLGPVPTALSVRRVFARAGAQGDLERYGARRAVCDELDRLSRGREEGSRRAARCLIVRRMLNDVRRFSRGEDAQEIFADLREGFHVRYGLLEASRGSYCDQGAFLSLERALSGSYVEALRRDADRAGIGGSSAARPAADRQVAAVKGSLSYRIGNAIVRAGRRLLPTTWYRALKTRL